MTDNNNNDEETTLQLVDFSGVCNKLNSKWTLWVHLPHDTDWTIDSYKHIISFSSVEEAVALQEIIPKKMLINCMIFLMRKGIKPVWESEDNRNGGCFSYKVNNSNIVEVWKNLYYSLIGETLSDNIEFVKNINGITISPKKIFCIVKIWTSGFKFTNPSIIINIPELNTTGCLFKKHKPEF